MLELVPETVKNTPKYLTPVAFVKPVKASPMIVIIEQAMMPGPQTLYLSPNHAVPSIRNAAAK